MKRLVFLLEEASAAELLKGLVPRLIGRDLLSHYIVFQGKSDLEQQLVRRIRAWQAPDSVFVVLRDQDAADCRLVKQRLSRLVADAGRAPVLVRVACHELESWIVGDLRAVAEAFQRPSVAEHLNKEKFRAPDKLVRPVEELRSLVPEYQKVDGARRVGPLLDPSRNTSHSFQAFWSGLERLVGPGRA
jgi:Domain of unknown function (DUF4276)